MDGSVSADHEFGFESRDSRSSLLSNSKSMASQADENAAGNATATTRFASDNVAPGLSDQERHGHHQHTSHSSADASHHGFGEHELDIRLLSCIRKEQCRHSEMTDLLKQGANVNATDAFRDTALHFAATHGHVDAVETLLEQGADVNHVNGKGRNPLTRCLIRDEAPVIHRDQRHVKGAWASQEDLMEQQRLAELKERKIQVAQLLMKAGADPIHTLYSITNVLEGVKDDAVEKLVSSDVLFSSPSPILTCFEMSFHLNRLAYRQEERRYFYWRLRDRCRDLAVDLLSHCRGMWDVRRLLADGTGVLSKAILFQQKEFIAHPFTQEYLKELWLGEYNARFGLSLYGVFASYLSLLLGFPVLLFLFMTQKTRSLRFSRLGDFLRMANTPFVKFGVSMLSLLGFIVVLILAINKKSREEPSTEELILAVWVVALILQEVREGIQTPSNVYFASLWNILDIVVMAAFLAVFAIRGVVWAGGSGENSTLFFAANQLFGICALLAVVRILNVMQTHHLLGPLQVIIARIIEDLFVFVSILVVFMLAFSVGLTKIYEQVEDIPANESVIDAFGSFPRTLRTLFWSIFALIEIDTLQLQGGQRSREIEALGHTVYGVYMVIVFILLINLLIAIINTSYQRIIDNADTEWKFARARLIRDYQNYPAVPAPLNLISEPLHLLLALFGVNLKTATTASYAQSSSDNTEEQQQLNKLLERLVAAHRRGDSSNVTAPHGHDGLAPPSPELELLREEREEVSRELSQMKEMLEAVLAKQSK